MDNLKAERGIGALVGSGKLENIEMAYNLAVSSGDEDLILYADVAFARVWIWERHVGTNLYGWDLLARVNEIWGLAGGTKHDVISRWSSVLLGSKAGYNGLLAELENAAVADIVG